MNVCLAEVVLLMIIFKLRSLLYRQQFYIHPNKRLSVTSTQFNYVYYSMEHSNLRECIPKTTYIHTHITSKRMYFHSKCIELQRVNVFLLTFCHMRWDYYTLFTWRKAGNSHKVRVEFYCNMLVSLFHFLLYIDGEHTNTIQT